MLNKNELQKMLQESMETILPGALEQAMKATYLRETNEGDKSAKKFAEVATELIAEPLSKALAGAIDYHVRSIDIYGTIVTVGSPTTQTAVVASPGNPNNGKVPNTLGVK